MRPLAISDLGFVGRVGVNNLIIGLSTTTQGGYGDFLGAGVVTLNCGTITGFAANGVSPFTYTWSKQSQSGTGNIYSNASTSEVNTFFWSGAVGAGGTTSSIWTLSGIDSASHSGVGANITISAEYWPGTPP